MNRLIHAALCAATLVAVAASQTGCGTLALHNMQVSQQYAYEAEMEALRLYRALLSLVGDASVFLEEYARSHIGEEEQHQLELRKMLRDYTPTD